VTHPRAGARRRRWIRLVGVAVFGAALAAVAVATGMLWRDIGSGRQEGAGLVTVAAAATVYAGSHLVRVVRLALLIGDPRISLRQIGLVHSFTAAVSFITPLKLGEAYRVLELGRILSDFGRSLVIVWVERAFDFGAIAVLVLLASIVVQNVLAALQPLILLSVTFVVMTLLLFVVLPEALRPLNLFVVRKYNGEDAIRRLQLIEWLQGWTTLGAQVAAKKISLLATLTAFIWGLELLALALLMPASSRGIPELISGLPVFLSGVSSGGLRVSRALLSSDHGLVISATLLLLGLSAGLLHAPTRLRDVGGSRERVGVRPAPRAAR
jgi:hypothetical protein